jgi:hypothetical protein
MTRAEAKAYRNKIDGVLTKVTTDAEALKIITGTGGDEE